MRVFIVPNTARQNTISILDTVTKALKKYNIEYYLPPQEYFLTDSDIQTFYENLLTEKNTVAKSQLVDSNAIISIGGDGTIVRCAGLSAHYGIPVLGINSGSLGFLAELEKENISLGIKKFAEQKYTLSLRSTLEVNANINGVLFSDCIINEIAISKPIETNIIRVNITCDGKFVDSFAGDGILFSTSTGSTAYALSAGGTVIDPQLPVINMVPICPHAIGMKPIAFSFTRSLTIVSSTHSMLIISDGKNKLSIPKDTPVNITGGKKQASFISFGEKEFFEILSNKLKHRE